jgi:hypothetical protein
MDSLLLSILLAAQPVAQGHVCLGDYVYRGDDENVSIGVRVRSSPDVFEVLFSDYGNIEATQIDWRVNSVVAVDKDDKSSVVLVCSSDSATIVLPADKYSSARTYPLRRSEGSLWDIGKREGWLQPGE